MADSGRTGAASTGAVGKDAGSTAAGRRAAIAGQRAPVRGAAAGSVTGTGTGTDAARRDAAGPDADSVTVVLRGADTARVRMPTPAERDRLGLGPDIPIWVISRAGGGTELYPGDSTVVVPAG